MNDRLVNALLQHKTEVSMPDISKQDKLKFATSLGNECIRVTISKSNNLVLDKGYKPWDFGYLSFSMLEDNIIRILKQQNLHYINPIEKFFRNLFNKDYSIEYNLR